MTDALLVLNAGSSSIKFALFELGRDGALALRYGGEVEGIGDAPRFVAHDASRVRLEDAALPSSAGRDLTHEELLTMLLGWVERHADRFDLVAAGHRVVHGGRRFAVPVRVTPAVLDELRTLVPLAPLHQPHNLAAIDALARLAPGLPQVACFDTAFHRTQPAVARAFALPRALTAAGVERYGFHGLSYEYIAGVLPSVAGGSVDRAVVAHLGQGASMCALRSGRSIATTMGFTALEGLVMGTRTGSIDPGVLLYLLEEKHMSPEELERLLYRESGLLGVSGLSNDMRTLLASPEPRAKLAVDLFVYRAVREIGSLAAALGGLDAIVFTAGIGERAAAVREAICAGCGWLGTQIEPRANAVHGPIVSTPGSRVVAAVIPTNEELMIARHTFAAAGKEMLTS